MTEVEAVAESAAAERSVPAVRREATMIEKARKERIERVEKMADDELLSHMLANISDFIKQKLDKKELKE